MYSLLDPSQLQLDDAILLDILITKRWFHGTPTCRDPCRSIEGRHEALMGPLNADTHADQS